MSYNLTDKHMFTKPERESVEELYVDIYFDLSFFKVLKNF